MNFKKKNTTVGSKMRPAMAVIDVVIAIGLVGLIVAGIIWMFTSAKPKMEMNAFQEKVMTVLTGIEKAKDDFNGGAYVANANALIPNIQKLKVALGGTRATTSLLSWQYSCTAGSNTTVRIVSERMQDTEILDGVVLMLNNKYSDWITTRSGNVLIIQKSNTACR